MCGAAVNGLSPSMLTGPLTVKEPPTTTPAPVVIPALVWMPPLMTPPPATERLPDEGPPGVDIALHIEVGRGAGIVDPDVAIGQNCKAAAGGEWRVNRDGRSATDGKPSGFTADRADRLQGKDRVRKGSDAHAVVDGLHAAEGVVGG